MEKQPFEQVVEENMAWLLRYVRGRLRNQSLAEDIVQEALVKAYRAYDRYTEEGRLKTWLGTVARHTLYTYLGREEPAESLDQSREDGGENRLPVSLGEDPQETWETREQVREILALLTRLPPRQRSAVYYRYVRDYSVEQTARLTGMPAGTVKSSAHYGLEKLRAQLGLNKGGSVMICKQAYTLLFNYAKGIITEENRRAVEEHLAGCEECRDIAMALKALVPRMTEAREDEKTHFLIKIPLRDGQTELSYTGSSNRWEEVARRLNPVLEKTGGRIPEGEAWFKNGYSSGPEYVMEHLAEWDNRGDPVEFVEERPENMPGNTQYWYTRMNRIYTPLHWQYTVFLTHRSTSVQPDGNAPGLYRGHVQNNLGSDAKSALYLALPIAAQRVRMQRGSGVLDCGPYSFAYVERYVTEEERISLDCTFILE